MSALTSALVFAGLALLVGALVVVVIAVLTRERPPRARPEERERAASRAERSGRALHSP